MPRRRTGFVLTGSAVAATVSLVLGVLLLPGLASIDSAAPNQAGGWRTLQRTGTSSTPAARQAGVWPLPTRCYEPLAGGRRPSAADHKVLGEIDAVVLANQRVVKGQLVGTVAGTAGTCAARLWKVIQALYPEQALALVDRYVVFEGTMQEGTTGEVSPDDAGATRWTLAIEMLTPDELEITLPHELGHLLSLNPTEVDPAPEPSDGCDTYPSGSGCSRSGSILDDYTANTWHESVLEKWFDIDDMSDEAKHDAALRKLYADNPTEFVDAYAATDPDEDFAETFAVWCLREPLLSPTLARKALFMQHRHELSGMRDRCRAVFG